MSRNRTTSDSGVRLGGDLFNFPPITGTGVNPAVAAELAGPLLSFLASLPYYLDEQGKLAYKSNTLALSHEPELIYGPDHPLAGQKIWALYSDGAYMTRFGNAPMPFIDMDQIPPHTLEILLKILQEAANTIANAT